MKIALLGATGSIGRQTLDVIRECMPHARVVAMTAHRQNELLASLARQFSCEYTYCGDDSDALCEAAISQCPDIVVNALVGRAGLLPTLAAIGAGIDIALANKETLVSAGEIVMKNAREKGVRITPIDSEHSAIWQCLNGENPRDIEKIILTASGGPFRAWAREEIEKSDKSAALQHPNWTMGSKITIDSATMMNKGLELIEAMHLFDVPQDKIEIVLHPQSIVHSAVQYRDGSIIAQMGMPDMRAPILYALTGARVRTGLPRVDFAKISQLTFEAPDTEKFPCLAIARHAAATGGTLPAVMNYVNEYAVQEFLAGRTSFYGISEIISQACAAYTVQPLREISDVIAAEKWAAQFTRLKGA